MSKRQLIASLCAALGVIFLAGVLAVRAFPLQAPAADENGVTVETGAASLLHRAPIQYPPEALEKRIEGQVVLELSLNEKGLVSDARVLSGPEELRRAALQSALQWHFSNDMSLPAKTQVTINFQLPPQGSPTKAEYQGRPFALGPRARSAAAPGGAGAPGAAPVPSAITPLGTLRQIQIDGLSPAARDALLSRLPVHVGDTLSNDAISRVQQVVRETDEHLVTGIRPSPDGTSILRIFIPGPASPYFEQQRKLAAEAARSGIGSGEGGGVGSGVGAGVGAGAAEAAAKAAASGANGPQRIRVGSLVQKTNLLQAPRPVYPPLAKQARIQGAVKLEAVISKDGAVENVTVLSGHPLLVPAALDAVKQWVYRPTLLNGNPVEVITQIDVNFTLLGEPPPQAQP